MFRLAARIMIRADAALGTARSGVQRNLRSPHAGSDLS
jgi:hypothetical protein